MDIIIVIAGITYLFLIPFFGGLIFFFGGLGFLANYDPEFDDPKKKHSAILDVVLGAALLLFFNATFWLAIYPLVVAHYNLNLPVLLNVLL